VRAVKGFFDVCTSVNHVLCAKVNFPIKNALLARPQEMIAKDVA